MKKAHIKRSIRKKNRERIMRHARFVEAARRFAILCGLPEDFVKMLV